MHPEETLDRIKKFINRTPVQLNKFLSRKYGAEIYLKREDLQVVRSYKLRGAFNKIISLSEQDRNRGVVCASAGNHAQGVAYSCREFNIKAVIFMPVPTPKQKINQTRMFGEDSIEIVLVGDTFDECQEHALAYTKEHNLVFIPPFDDYDVIEGQSTVGVEILEDIPQPDIIILPIGGGGLASGVGYYLKSKLPDVRIFGIEPEGAASMAAAMTEGMPVTLNRINGFVDGAAAKRVGEKTFAMCKTVLDDIKLIPEGKVCSAILELYNRDAIVAEPAGALSIAALDYYRSEIKGKRVVCVISGGNNDIDRMGEIKELSLLYEGLKHYFIVLFPQRPGALKQFVNQVLGPEYDITRFDFIKKTQREFGPALVGIELRKVSDYEVIIHRMKESNFDYIEINEDKTLFEYLI